MNCSLLAMTGSWIVPVVALAVIGGLVLMCIVRTKRARAAVMLSVVIAIAGVLSVAGTVISPAHAPVMPLADRAGAISSMEMITTNCRSGSFSTAPEAVVITPAGRIDGLAPGGEAIPIAGQVTNRGADGALVDTVTVGVVSVREAEGARGGRCDIRDFVVLHPRMNVRHTLDHNETVAFHGASVKLVNTAKNQDACKNATVVLKYVAS